jgi:putative ABC transport system permease protein
MRPEDSLRFSFRALTDSRGRSWLILLAMSLGVGSIMLLTSLGEGARQYVIDEFSSLGTHLLVVLPGKTETTGGAPPLVGGTPRDLTLNDALALNRISNIKHMAPLVFGSAPLSYKQLDREVMILGSTQSLLPVRNLKLAEGRFLPGKDPRRESSVVVIGSKLKQALFGNPSALGKWVRIHDSRFRVIGILKPMGESLGLDLGDIAIIPVASALRLFNTHSLYRIMVQASGLEDIPRVEQAMIEILRARHEGEEDVTVIRQDALLNTFDGIFQALTYTVAGIGSISLAVAGILIMNVMLISVSRRTAEIGLLKALGTPQKQILRLFLVEAGLLALSGAVAGIAIAFSAVWLSRYLYPAFPLIIPLWSLVAAVLVSLLTGLIFGVLPARKAARLDPIQALNG